MGYALHGLPYTQDWGTKTQKKDRSPAEAKAKKAGYMKGYMPGYRATHREEIRRNNRKCVPPLSELVPGYVPLNAAKELPPPPCGGDCKNCPYDDGCHYPDRADEDDVYITPAGKKVSREARRKANRAYAARQKEKRAVDQKLDEQAKANARRYSAKHRAKVKFVKAGGHPEEFEKQWEERMMDNVKGETEGRRQDVAAAAESGG